MQGVTQHRSGEGWVYLAVVIDAWSQRVVGWSIADHLGAEMVVDAIDMATMRRRRPARPFTPTPGPNTAAGYSPTPPRRRADGLVGTVGDGLDDAVAESFFASLQCELLDRHHWPTRAGLARRSSTGWKARHDNPTRRHSTVAYLSPVDYETAGAA